MRTVGPGLPAAATRLLFFCKANYYPFQPISYVPGMGFRVWVATATNIFL